MEPVLDMSSLTPLPPSVGILPAEADLKNGVVPGASPGAALPADVST
jgi:hypothetical protein